MNKINKISVVVAFFLIFSIFSPLPTSASETKGHPDSENSVLSSFLGSLLEKSSLDGSIAVIALFKEDKPLPQQSSHRASHRLKVLKTMEENMTLTKGKFISLSKGIPVSSVQWLPIVNGVAFTTSVSSLRSIVKRAPGNLLKIYSDEIIESPKVFESKNATPPKEEWTYGLKALHIPEIRKLYGLTGKDVLIGHIDTGVDGSHPEIQGKIAAYKDFVDPGNTVPTDVGGHGSHTAGTIAGGCASGIHIGVAPNAKLVVARAIGGSGGSKLLNAMGWMCDPDDSIYTDDAPRVVSCSWHSGNGDQTLYYKAIETWVKMGILANFSAGNRGYSGAETLTHPKEHPGSVCCGAVGENLKIARFSSRGPATYLGKKLDKPEWVASGVDIYSMYKNGTYKKNSGTSMAAPHIAGLIALVLEVKPELTITQIRDLLCDSTLDLGVEGYDHTFGNGLPDSRKIIEKVFPSGKISGLVQNPEGIALKASIKIEECDYSFSSDETGEFLITLPEGSYTLKVAAYGYVTTTVQVTVESDGIQTVKLSLVEASIVNVTGIVLSKETGSPVKAKVSVFIDPGSSPVATAETDPSTGEYSVDVSEGTYYFRFSGFCYKDKLTKPVNVVENPIVSVKLMSIAPILLVNDDDGKNYGIWYKDSIKANGFNTDVWDTTLEGSVKAENLYPYDIVVWQTGRVGRNPLSKEEKKAMVSYIDGGGLLLLSGQDIASSLKYNPWLRTELRTKFVRDFGKSKIVEGEGFSFSIKGGTGATNQYNCDIITGGELAGPVVVPLKFKDEEAGASVRFEKDTAKVWFITFGIEGIADEAIRNDFVGHCLKWLNPSIGNRLARFSSLNESQKIRYVDFMMEGFESFSDKDVNTILSESQSNSSVRLLSTAILQRIHAGQGR